ncbi:16S rRNA (guanine(527)-N(7))-methyltransferase RsmG [Tropicimonas sp. IMCC6043]|uniref:16S rRNA (guanine(527)-N(7))-methyltransferase RsmG n=1 Tax=Tropicimonas sp. IMCC6043 TaxID=2510645 RepID=UPI001F5DA31F|nr:16S rRNA (guanine(527)-N(7))-methyltransferase RsmG [Tropicimonas sp. IMCC6043]
MPDLERSLREAVRGHVSRETLDRLKAHLSLLRKWNAAINLVAPSTLAEGWDRHIIDSAQVFSCAPQHEGHWIDIGSGGGFPGLVCAIIAKERAPGLEFSFVESDKRKAAFLSTAVQALDIEARVLPSRIETLPSQNADIVTARALAPLSKLLGLAAPHLAPAGTCIFPKGERHAEELSEARPHWRFKLSQVPSITGANAVILVLGEIERV